MVEDTRLQEAGWKVGSWLWWRAVYEWRVMHGVIDGESDGDVGSSRFAASPALIHLFMHPSICTSIGGCFYTGWQHFFFAAMLKRSGDHQENPQPRRWR